MEDQGVITRVRLQVDEPLLRDFRPTIPAQMLRAAQVQNPAKVEGDNNSLFGEWWVDVLAIDGEDSADVGIQCILMYVKKLWTM